jgi:hypothetical protein
VPGVNTPTPTAPHPITEYLLGRTPDGPEPIGSFAIRLVLTSPDAGADPAAWAITHPLGSPANSTYTEVVFVDEAGAELPERLADDLVRQVAATVYGPGRWAFHYRPEEVPRAVLAHGTLLRERVEVSAVEVWT